MPTNLPINYQTIIEEYSIPEHSWSKANITCPVCGCKETWIARVDFDTYVFECDECGYSKEE